MRGIMSTAKGTNPKKERKKKMKRSGYYECFERVEKARTATPVNTNDLEIICDLYGYDLYKECLRDVIKKYNLD